jgi:hypothetical protein
MNALHELEVREAAIVALARLGAADEETPPQVIPALRVALDDAEAGLRAGAAAALGEIGAKAKEAIPRLQSRYRSDPNHVVRREARWALKKIRADLARQKNPPPAPAKPAPSPPLCARPSPKPSAATPTSAKPSPKP